MTLASDVVSETFASPVRLGFVVLAVITTIIISLANRPAFASKAPPLSKYDRPIFGALEFFRARWEFFETSIRNSPTGSFSYYLGKYRVIGLSGDESRKFFFDSKALGFTEGYSVLFDGVPSSKIDQDDDGKGFSGYFIKRLVAILKGDSMTKHVPTLLTDCRGRIEELGSSGTTDPYQSIYRIVFLLTMRMVGAREIADDPKKLETTLSCFETIEASSTPTGIMFPMLPIPSKLRRYIAGARLAMMFSSIIKDRKATGRREDDCLQFLLDNGDSLKNMLSFVLGALFAGQLNSGINAAGMLCHVTDVPGLKEKLLEEVKAVAAKNCADPKAPLVEQLKTLPVEVWESGFPLIDLCLRESIRMHLHGSAFRRNITAHEISIGNKTEVIPVGAFVTYHLNDIHMNPNVYTNPETYDPTRFLPDRAEDKKVPHAFVGWGAGRHPCLGMRFAKLEQNMICAHWIAMMEYELVDAQGKVMSTPVPDANAWSSKKPKTACYFRYKRRTDL